jgi:hypothetical protein
LNLLEPDIPVTLRSVIVEFSLQSHRDVSLHEFCFLSVRSMSPSALQNDGMS